jgi:hypothetical protein
MDHDVLVGSDDGGVATAIVNSEEYVDADDIYDGRA